MSRKSMLLAVILLSLTPITSAFSLNLKRGLDLDYGPAPSPEDGPPLSANASRNPALIPFQVAGIVGSYLIVLVVLAIGLWLANRRLRKRAISEKSDVELVQPKLQVTIANAYDPSPVSPGNPRTPNFSWPSPEKAHPNPYVFPSGSPLSQRGNDAFDRRVIESDRDLLQRNLEDLYAHVMEFEEAKANGVMLKDPLPPQMRTQMQHAAPAPAEAPQRQTLSKGRRPSGLSIEDGRAEKEKSHSRTSSIISSLKSPKRKGIRSMRISSPIPTPLSATFPQQSDEEPLSPRYYSPPPPPPVPGQSYPRSGQSSTDPSPISHVRNVADQLAGVSIDPRQQQNYGHGHNQSYSSMRSSRGPLSANSTNSQTPFFSHSQGQAGANDSQMQPPAGSYGGGSRPLPFRAYEPSVTSTTTQNTKMTVLERTPLSPGLKTPFTAGAVPYSPYQPFTPVIPMTPTLMTKQELKAKKKEEKKKPAMEMIKSDDELWDSGW